MSIEDNLQEPLLERLSASPEPEDPIKTQSSAKKRKRGPEQDQSSRKTAKKSKTKKANAVDEDELDIELGINTAFSHMDNQLLADYVAQRTRKYESDLSLVELEDKYISATAIRDTTSFDKPRTLDNLPAFLEKFSGNTTKLWSASKKNGAPHTIIVAMAGIRAADLARVVRKFHTKDAKVAKLFGKHIKMQDAIKFLKSTRTGIAVGTPARIKDLLDDGALATDRLERIVIDCSYIDQKKKGILETKETQIALIQLLGEKQLRERYNSDSGSIDLLFY
ncbi:hypothetical protein M430DRAFT_106629 [Amorphotheca resinae ATCC 22711]|uniref:Protein CMS1 n=1 Tax=Amorphotheca resinae ATCC 22711 TaxID=857342 RepID=A0A2T3AUW4_AMORE|nr:hypothetical protein M430DRAFT_106629 [Amorphotheca resinae ATCC 22711]PSS12451.1 hypothetical protein M430DRAFT_106629 [Amorphotheca resinae ATCC 22711]